LLGKYQISGVLIPILLMRNLQLKMIILSKQHMIVLRLEQRISTSKTCVLFTGATVKGVEIFLLQQELQSRGGLSTIFSHF
jgi:hypothetical protein